MQLTTRTRLGLAILLLAGAGCSPRPPRPDPKAAAEARRELEERARADQAVREAVFGQAQLDTLAFFEMQRTDSANTLWLKDWIARWGWPRAEDVGKEGVEAAALIVQHAVHDTAFMRAMLPAIEESARRGDLRGQDVAMLADRLAVHAGHPQRYGTQASLRDGRIILDPIEDSANVDARRRAIGLPPLAEYLRVLDSVYRLRPE